MAKNNVTVAVIGEGITEKYYIESLRDILTIKPTPVKPKSSSLKELENTLKECIKKGYDRVYCLIDVDNKIIDGNADHDRNAREYAQLRKRYHNKQHRCPNGSKTFVLMIESFPATEIFFLYYFGYTSAFYSNKQLKHILNKRIGYLTEERYLIKHSLHDTLVEYGGSLEVAVKASEKSMSDRLSEVRDSSFSEIGVMIRFLQ